MIGKQRTASLHPRPHSDQSRMTTLAPASTGTVFPSVRLVTATLPDSTSMLLNSGVAEMVKHALPVCAVAG